MSRWSSDEVLAWLMPDPPRRVPRERAWNVMLRTFHLMAFGLLLGGHFWDVPAERLVAALAIAVASGAALMALELYKSLHWLFLGKGLMVLAKLLLLVAMPVFWEARVPILLAVVAVASVGAHMPARYRHYSVLYRRVVEIHAETGGFTNRGWYAPPGVTFRKGTGVEKSPI